MARTSPDAVHVTYPPLADGRLTAAAGDESLLAEVRVHGSKDVALEYAVDNGHKYVPVRKGESLVEAIARYAADRNAKAKPAGRPVADRPQA